MSSAVAERVEPGMIVQATESATILSVIERMALTPELDPERLERYMRLYEQMEAKKAKTAFFVAFAAAQAEMPQVVRDADNDQTKSKYARYETISEAIQPVITKHGFSTTFGEGKADQPNHVRILCKLMHIGGHSEDYHADVPIDMYGMKGNPNKTATHAYGSTKSYGRRYLKVDIFDIAVKGSDDDGNAAGGRVIETITDEQRDELLRLLEDAGATADQFCAVAKIEAIPDLPASRFDRAKTWIANRKVEVERKATDPKASLDKQFGSDK